MLHADEPLQAEPRLDRHIGALRITHLVVVVLYFLHQVQGFQILYDLLAAFKAIHAVVLAYVGLQLLFNGVHIEVGIRREDINGAEVVFLPQGVVIDIVSRGNLQTAGTETDLYVAVFDDGYDATNARYNHMFALQPLVLLFLGVNADGYISEDSLRTRCGHHGIFAGLLDHLVTQVVELAVLVVVDDLLVAQRCLPLGVPVDHAQSAVDESLAVEVAEHLNDGFRTGLVHRERGAVPVA